MDRIYAVIGLGSVGLELALALSKHAEVIGFDLSQERISELSQHHDHDGIISEAALKKSPIKFTAKLHDIKPANFYFVTVPTPVYYYTLPDLENLVQATYSIAKMIKKGDFIVYESTVYPGTTEEISIKVIEDVSKLTCGVDFEVGYSSEHYNPGDNSHNLANSTKVVGATNQRALKEIVGVYETICQSVYPASSIKVAEASKMLENTQKDVNIALMNEFSKIMHAMDIDVDEVIDAASKRWQFTRYKPGLVGGHRVAVDPLYLAFKAKRHGIDPEIILTARKVNDGMSQYIIQEMVKLLMKRGANLHSIKIGIFGVTYKNDIPDVRNSMVLKLTKELNDYQINYVVHDPIVEPDLLSERYQINPVSYEDLHDLDVAILAVGHRFYVEKGLSDMIKKVKTDGIFMDIPSLFKKKEALNFANYTFWWL
ncbi:nucleotide sugar dehydrogenase [Legionella sp. W05-934-2]|jgi:UDP-N-acetyl-D-galactosamine dehydrogenase|uniref:nucleotide sugar dehydrogenase n=1 Tax=Legionella sp. W05-934-2 TaxID=1198649 RepID=UPI0034635656